MLRQIRAAVLFAGWLAQSASAQSTINTANRLAYGANIGWLDWRADGANGAVLGEYVCTGYIYAANVGWINLGGGVPANGIRYQNNSASDFGVNHDGLGNLRGYAWGANIGWVNFENQGAPRLDLCTGKLIGFSKSFQTSRCIMRIYQGVARKIIRNRALPFISSFIKAVPRGFKVFNCRVVMIAD